MHLRLLTSRQVTLEMVNLLIYSSSYRHLPNLLKFGGITLLNRSIQRYHIKLTRSCIKSYLFLLLLFCLFAWCVLGFLAATQYRFHSAEDTLRENGMESEHVNIE